MQKDNLTPTFHNSNTKIIYLVFTHIYSIICMYLKSIHKSCIGMKSNSKRSFSYASIKFETRLLYV